IAVRKVTYSIMKKPLPCLVAALGSVLLGACSTLPSFVSPIAPDALTPRVSDIVEQVQREVVAAVAKEGNQAGLKALQEGTYVMNVNLTLDVTDSQSANPTLSYIDPLKVTGTKFTVA